MTLPPPQFPRTAQETAEAIGRRLAYKLLLEAQASVTGREITSEDIQAAWRKESESSQRSRVREAVIGLGWLFLGVFIPEFIDSISTGSLPLEFALLGFGGLLLLIVGFRGD